MLYYLQCSPDEQNIIFNKGGDYVHPNRHRAGCNCTGSAADR